ncbi:biotin/lipoyl-containing protein [Legionella spiritensis]|uniref:Dihydrolipoamide succinyltransferase subunit E2 n=1 Tax=Legionella spiritensis TaxID=452 RepID=A0A0W0YVQ1_LEGSP|nr:biotin/lipoyl-containing protein [Legionella spiritensis]KTD60992.1 dihydrolipoamide succinyltransferase subunit E2 [Legionella spiritensis]SNV32174.1 dihydrolipoamide succinyltransferase subunit E2 [Legionella spiritensis]
MPHDIIMPVLGMNQDTGSIACWHKKPGDAIAVGDIIMDVETDKAVMEIEARHSGFLGKIFYEAGSEVPVGNVVAVIDPAPEFENQASETGQEEIKAPAPHPLKTQPSATVIPLVSESVLASPKARSLVKQHGITLQAVAHHCNRSIVHAADVDQFIAEQQALSDDVKTLPNPAPVPRQTCRLVITVSSDGMKDCESWLLRQQDHNSRNAGHLLATLAASLMRSHRLYQDTAPLTIQVDNWDGQAMSESYISDPDYGRFSRLEIHSTATTEPCLHVLYLSGSHITALSIENSPMPTILVTDKESGYEILISGFDTAKLSELIRFAQQLAQAIEQPLLHLT